MFAFPNPKTKNPKERRIQRTLEVIPGILTWFTIIGRFAFSFFLPDWVAYFIITFDIYWILRTIFIAHYSIDGYKKLRDGKKIDWWERCQNISNPKNYIELIGTRISKMEESLRDRIGMVRRDVKILKGELNPHHPQR